MARVAGGCRPAFDINPNPNVSEERVTGIGGARGRADELTGLMAYAATFGLTETDARTILTEVNEATRTWRTTAAANGIATIYAGFLSAGLPAGAYRAAPDATVVGDGLAGIPEALERLRAGGSATKLVVTV